MCSRRSRTFRGTRPPCGRDRDNVDVEVVTQQAEAFPDASTAGFAIVVDGLRKRYGSLAAVDGISFRVKDREVLGLLGPDGAGKTTTDAILEGLRVADGGRAILAGLDGRKEP